MEPYTKKNYKGAVFFDFDGTLVDEREKLFMPTKATLDSIEKLKNNGYMVALSTGRARCYVPESGIDFDCYVTSNGACANVDGNYVVDDLMTKDEIKRLITYFDENNYGYVVENDKECFFSRQNQDGFIRMMNNFNLCMDCFYPMPQEYLDLKINKMMFTVRNDEEFVRLKQNFGNEFNITPHRSNPSGDLVKKKINKAYGIKAVMKAYKLDLCDTFAFGDGENDYEMLAVVGQPIIMGRHALRLEDTGGYITDTVINEGVTKGLEHFGLI